MEILRDFIKKLRHEFKEILGEVDHMNEDYALKKLDEAILKVLLEG